MATAGDGDAAAGFADGSHEVMLLVRVMSGNLLKNFESFGRMDPQATVEWITKDGHSREFGRTHVDWNAHFNPKWNFTCRGQKYPGPKSGDSLKLSVWEVDVVGSPDFCGSAQTTLDGLIYGDGAAPPGGAQGEEPFYGPVRELKLFVDSEETGSITVQGVLFTKARGGHPGAQADLEGNTINYSLVDPSRFETPVKRLQVSGGTAPFFSLKLRDPLPDQSASHFIGKDLAHASDEINFYELALQYGPKGTGELSGLLQFVPEYAGVLLAPEEGQAEEREILVMQNFKDGHQKSRMLDVKMGQKTGQAGWQGKSRTAAMRQSIVDGMTNSNAEGFRLEGFDNRPAALASQDPMMDMPGAVGNGKKLRKKAERVVLQRMQGAEMMNHFLDVHIELPSPDEAALAEAYGPSELLELTLHETVLQLLRLARACRQSPVPQKWIGSSVALGFDCGELPKRSVPLEKLRKSTLVSIFDWGRSELNTLDRHMEFSDAERQDRATFWSYYTGGVDRLAYEACRAYHHRFSSRRWQEVVFTVFDYDSLAPNDFIGRVNVMVAETPETTVDVVDPHGIKRGQLSYSIDLCEYPKSSRLESVWQVRVVKAKGLPSYDKMMMRKTVDAFVEVTAMGDEGVLAFRQFTMIKPKTNDPEWNEVFELPVALKDDHVLEAMGCEAHSVTDAMFPMEKRCHVAIEATKLQKTPSFSLNLKRVNIAADSHIDNDVGQGFKDFVTLLTASSQSKGVGGSVAPGPSPPTPCSTPASRLNSSKDMGRPNGTQDKEGGPFSEGGVIVEETQEGLGCAEVKCGPHGCVAM